MAAPQDIKDVVFVVVPGSFATVDLYEDNIVAGLREKGYEVRPVELLSANDGSRLPPPKMEDDAAFIRENVLSILDDEAKPRNVVLSLHSYSGLPGSSALEGLSKADREAQGKNTAVIGIVYIGSFLAPLGTSVRDLNPDAPEPWKSGLPGEYFPLLPEAFAPMIFNDFPPEEVPRRFATLTRHSSDSYSGKTSYEAWKYIPSVQIIPGNDVIVPVALQEDMYQKAVAAGAKVKRVFVEGAGHAVNASRTALVVDELVSLVKEFSEAT